MRKAIKNHPTYTIDSETAEIFDKNGRLVPQRMHKVKKRMIIDLRVRPGKGGVETKEVHVLQCLTHVGGKPTTPPTDGGRWEVSHKDNNKLNNAASNLEWKSTKENQANSKGVPRKRSKKMSDAKVRRLLRDRAKGMTIIKLSEKYDRHPTYVSAICNGKARPNA